MIRRMRFFSMVAVLMAVLAINVILPATAVAQSSTPCTDAWAGCVAGGGGDAFCDGLWCGCMYSNYGYICEIQIQ